MPKIVFSIHVRLMTLDTEQAVVVVRTYHGILIPGPARTDC